MSVFQGLSEGKTWQPSIIGSAGGVPIGVGVAEGAGVGGGVGVAPTGGGPPRLGRALGLLEHATAMSSAAMRAHREHQFIVGNSVYARWLQRAAGKCDAVHRSGEATKGRR